MTSPRAPAAICGTDPSGTFPANRLGCGERIETCAAVFRCTECTVPFHRHCAEKHFDTRRNTYYNPQAIAYQILLAMDRKGFNEAHHPKLQVSLIPCADKWLKHYVELLVKSPLSAVGPLASLLADVVHETRRGAVILGIGSP